MTQRKLRRLDKHFNDGKLDVWTNILTTQQKLRCLDNHFNGPMKTQMSGQTSAMQRGVSTFCYSASVLHCLPVSKVFKIFDNFFNGLHISVFSLLHICFSLCKVLTTYSISLKWTSFTFKIFSNAPSPSPQKYQHSWKEMRNFTWFVQMFFQKGWDAIPGRGHPVLSANHEGEILLLAFHTI